MANLTIDDINWLPHIAYSDDTSFEIDGGLYEYNYFYYDEEETIPKAYAIQSDMTLSSSSVSVDKANPKYLYVLSEDKTKWTGGRDAQVIYGPDSAGDWTLLTIDKATLKSCIKKPPLRASQFKYALTASYDDQFNGGKFSENCVFGLNEDLTIGDLWDGDARYEFGYCIEPAHPTSHGTRYSIDTSFKCTKLQDIGVVNQKYDWIESASVDYMPIETYMNTASPVYVGPQQVSAIYVKNTGAVTKLY